MTEAIYEVGGFVRFHEGNYARVSAVFMDGSIMATWANGDKAQVNHDNMRPSNHEEYLDELKALAAKDLMWTEDDFVKHHVTAANKVGLPLYALETLDAVREIIEDIAVTNGKRQPVMMIHWDSRGVEIHGEGQQRRLTIKQLDKEIASAEVEEKAELFEFLTGVYTTINDPEIKSKSGHIDKRLHATVTEFLTQEPVGRQRKRKTAESASPAESQPEPVQQPGPEPVAQEPVSNASIFAGIPVAKPLVDMTRSIFAQYCTEVEIPKPGDAQPVTEPEPAASTAAPVAPVTEDATTPVRTDAGLIDPQTGEILEPSMIMRKFGWTEMPSLPTDREPTTAELSNFEAKINQVAEKCAVDWQTAARWTKQTEKKAKPLNEAGDFWWEQFVLPMSKLLAPYRLPTYQSGAKKGEYSKKTLHLDAMSISFKTGGGYYIHDKKAIVKHIADNGGVQQFAAIEARETIEFSHRKMLSALKTGALRDIPGTGHTPVKALATAKPVVPGVGGKQEEEDTDSNE